MGKLTGRGEGAAAVAPLAVLAILGVSLVGAIVEVSALVVDRRASLPAAASAPLSRGEGVVWILSLVAIWTVFDAAERHIGWRVATDQLERRWANDLSRQGVLRALEQVQANRSRLYRRALLLRNAPAVLAWGLILSLGFDADSSVPPLLLAANGIALIFSAVDRLSASAKPIDRARPAIARSMSKVTDLRAIGAETAAYRHLWRRFVQDRPRELRGACISREMRKVVAAAACGGVCFAAADLWPANAERVGLLVLVARALVSAWRPKTLLLSKDPPASNKEPARPAPPPPGQAALTAQSLDVVGEFGEVLRAISFRAAVGSPTWLYAPSERERRLIIDVLLGLHQVERGCLKLGDERPDQLDGRRWRTRCGFVPLRTTLVRGSLRDNLLISAPDASSEVLFTGVIAASPHGASSRLLDLMDARIGAACRLTLGELRTVSFARALMRRPELIIVEGEPDGLSISEARHFDRLMRALAQRCVVVVAVTSWPNAGMQASDTAIVLGDQ